MSRKKAETEVTTENIKPEYSIHLEELLKEKGLKKQELAAMIHTTPQTISKVCQGIRITRSIAESIVKEFPEYYIGWVLGWKGSPKYLKDVRVQIESAEKKQDKLFLICMSSFLMVLLWCAIQICMVLKLNMQTVLLRSNLPYFPHLLFLPGLKWKVLGLQYLLPLKKMKHRL